ncbi:UNVERIFIED_CONTAM: Cucumisin [Sesamum angustifolium]|uniref:Cucumisin n=1 Tax=Sesamum angustifolium TaxID=2727405 RepID=A0AAW2MII6_9LAMI
MGDRPQGGFSLASTHHSMLRSVLESGSSAEESLVYSYDRSFNGFAAKLTKQEAASISEMEGVVSVIPNRMLKLHTTRSWTSWGSATANLEPARKEKSFLDSLTLESGQSILALMTLVLALHRLNGRANAKPKISPATSIKLIGARYYNSDNDYDDADIHSPRDTEGHGTHTSSTAAGVELPGTSFLGLAEGVARGGVPNARIAVYKVCWDSGCGLADILKAFDDAIGDGVDVISVSLGSDWPSDYFDDPIAIGSFHAMKNGILTSNSAGNSGPEPVTVSNFAPWTMTVAASTIDRKFVANLALGNGQILTDGSAILLANGIGIVMMDPTVINPNYAFSYPLPATLISPDDGRKVMEYIRSTKYPMATILMGETWKDAMAPTVVSFSSRGPSPVSPDILKPDIAAPGVDILAGWSPLAPPSIYYRDSRSLYFNVISGTSMACPHASATAAYVKAAHPDWSPAAIKSAIMTTAYIMDPRRHNDLEFAYGSGHINPAAALDPGLVFDVSATDYINFLCKQGYNTTTLRLVTGDNSTCTNTTLGRAWDLNYPSLSLYVEDGQQIMGTFTRTVTNVAVGETQSFTVKVTGPAISQQPITSGAITWRDGTHAVRSPLVVYNYIPGAPYTLYSEDSTSMPEKKRVLNGLYKDHRSGIIRHS